MLYEQTAGGFVVQFGGPDDSHSWFLSVTAAGVRTVCQAEHALLTAVRFDTAAAAAVAAYGPAEWGRPRVCRLTMTVSFSATPLPEASA